MTENGGGLSPRMIRAARLNHAFTPAAPVHSASLFAGRSEQLVQCIGAIFQPGLHVALYGERGVGKTSLANVIPAMIESSELPELGAVRIDCNTQDNYSSIWKKVFRELYRSSPDELPSPLEDPEDVRFELEKLSRHTLIVIDEFDRVEDDDALSLLADTVKTLSDHTVEVTLMFVGVATSIELLLGEHESIGRNIREVRIKRMSVTELADILKRGYGQVGDLAISDAARQRIIFAAEGLPHFVHVLGLGAGQIAINNDRDTVGVKDVERAEAMAVQTHSMQSEYHKATESHQPSHLFHQVLLACAYAPRDVLGYFKAADVRHPLSVITGKPAPLQKFQRHLKELSEDRQTLYMEGSERHRMYRFRDPLFQPFVKMAARARRIITIQQAKELQEYQQTASAPNISEAEPEPDFESEMES
jgi:Cdc6-like AAA superfamily ATPase